MFNILKILAFLILFVTSAHAEGDSETLFIDPEPFHIYKEPAVKHYEEIQIQKPGGASAKLLVPNRGVIDIKDIAVVLNDNEAFSKDVGAYFINLYQIPASNVIRLNFTAVDYTQPQYFAPHLQELYSKLLPNIQAVVLIFNDPYKIYNRDEGYANTIAAVSTVNAVAFGLTDVGYYSSVKSPSAYEYSPKPFDDFKYRPTMMIRGESAEAIKASLAKSKNAYGTFPHGTTYVGSIYPFANSLRNYWNTANGLETNIYATSVQPTLSGKSDVLFYHHHAAEPKANENSYQAGAIAYTGTEFKADIAHKWIENGAAATAGSVNIYSGTLDQSNFNLSIDFEQIIKGYFNGAQALQAMWGADTDAMHTLLLGNPLARPFGTIAGFEGSNLIVSTTTLLPNRNYILMGGNDINSLAPVSGNFSIPSHQLYSFMLNNASFSIYKIVDNGAINPVENIVIDPKFAKTRALRSIGPHIRFGEQISMVVNKPCETFKFVKLSIDGKYLSYPHGTKYGGLPPDHCHFYMGYTPTGTLQNPAFKGHPFSTFGEGPFAKDGVYEFKARFIDINDDVTTYTQKVKVVTAPDTQPPVLTIDSPQPNSYINDDTIIAGTVTDDTFVENIEIYLAKPGREEMNGVKSVIIRMPLSGKFSITFKQLKDRILEEYHPQIFKPGLQLSIRIKGSDNPQEGKSARNSFNLEIPFTYISGAIPPSVQPTPGGNILPPGGKSIAIMSPKANALVSKSVNVEMYVDLTEEIESVELSVPKMYSKLFKKVKSSPFSKKIPLKNFTKGKTYTIKAIVRYKNGKKSSAKQKIKVM